MAVDMLDEIERAHSAHLQVENLNAVIAEFQGSRRCPYCNARFVDMGLYRRHVTRANRTGYCLGGSRSGASGPGRRKGKHSQHLYIVPEQRPHDVVEAVPREEGSMRAELEADGRYRVVGYEEAMALAARSGWIVSPCWCGGDGFSQSAESYPTGAIGRKLRAGR